MSLKQRAFGQNTLAGESSRSNTWHTSEEDEEEEEERQSQTSYSEGDDPGETDEEGDLDEEEGYLDQQVQPSESASTRPLHPRHLGSGRAPSHRNPLAHHRHQNHFYPSVRDPAPPPSSVAPSGDYGGGLYGTAFHQPYNRGLGIYGSRGHGLGHHPYAQNQGGHYMAGYPGGNQVVPYGSYGGHNPFTPVNNGSSGASYFSGGDGVQSYDMMPYQPPHGFYGPPHQYNLPVHMQHFTLSPPAPAPPANEAPAQPTPSPTPKEPPIDLEKIRLEAHEAARKEHEAQMKAMQEKQERENQIRKEAEAAFVQRMEDMRKQQEETQREIARAKADAEAAAMARIEAERKAADERARQEAEALRRAEENAIRKYEKEMKEAEKRREEEQKARERIEADATRRLEAALKADAEAKALAAQKQAEEAERIRQMQEDAQRKAEADARARLEAEAEAARKAAEAEEAARQAHEALTKKIQEEARAAAEEAARTKTENGSIKFKDAVGRKFSFPYNICNTWQGMQGLIKQAFMHVEVIGPHVQEGRYDLTGPDGEIILPSVWEKVLQPDWCIEMTMWPVEDKKPEPEPELPMPDIPPIGLRPGAMPMPHGPGIPGIGRPPRGMPVPGMMPGWGPPRGHPPPHMPDDMGIPTMMPRPVKKAHHRSGTTTKKVPMGVFDYIIGTKAKHRKK